MACFALTIFQVSRYDIANRLGSTSISLLMFISMFSQIDSSFPCNRNPTLADKFFCLYIILCMTPIFYFNAKLWSENEGKSELIAEEIDLACFIISLMILTFTVIPTIILTIIYRRRLN